MTAKKKRPAREGGPVVLGLVRVSTEEQAASGAGLAAQTTALHDEAGRRGWNLELIVEDGVSGKEKAKRPKLDEALARLDAGEADILAVAKLDRLCRSTVKFGAILTRAKEQGWTITVLDFGMDTSTTNGKMMAQMLMVIAEWERDTISDRTTVALAEKKSAGVRLGRSDALDPAVRSWIVGARAVGRSPQNIADELNHRQTPTAHGGVKWHASTVRAILGSQAAAEVTA